MRDFLAFCALMACIAVFLFSVVALFRPLPLLKLGNRKRALMGLVLSLMLLITTAVIIPPPSGETAAPEAQPASADAKVNNSALEKETRQLWGQFIGAVKQCDAMSKKVADVAAAEAIDVYDFYSAADRAATDCSVARMAVAELEVPPSSEGVSRSAFASALGKCTDAYQAKAVGYAEMAKVIDGDHRPSKVMEVKEMGEAASAMQLQCVAAFFEAVGKANLPADLLKGA